MHHQALTMKMMKNHHHHQQPQRQQLQQLNEKAALKNGFALRTENLHLIQQIVAELI
jgi:hypothetical protein